MPGSMAFTPSRPPWPIPAGKLGRAVLTARAAEAIGEKLLARVRVEPADLEGVSRLLPPGAVHQGAALEVHTLRRPGPGRGSGQPEFRNPPRGAGADQLSDTHNVGAILRSAAAFGVVGGGLQDRNAPPKSGMLAKAASGALETVPYVVVVNISRALEELGERVSGASR